MKEAAEARTARARRDAELSPRERLQRVAVLCRQLASIRFSPPPLMVLDLAALLRG